MEKDPSGHGKVVCISIDAKAIDIEHDLRVDDNGLDYRGDWICKTRIVPKHFRVLKVIPRVV